MAPPPLNVTVRYFPPGTRKYYYVAAIAAYAAPTRAELNAGTDLSAEVAEISGFTITSNSVDTPDLGGRFTGKIPGRLTSDDSTITCYASSNSNDVRLVMPRDTTGYIVILPEGDIAGQRMDVFPVRVSAAYLDTTIEDPGKVLVVCTITKLPAQNVVIPA